MSVNRRVVQRSISIQPLDRDIGPVLDQSSDDFQVAVVASFVQRRPAGVVLRVDVGSLPQQLDYFFVVALDRGSVERSFSAVVSLVQFVERFFILELLLASC